MTITPETRTLLSPRELADALPACCEEIRRGSDPDQPEAPQREREFSFLLPFPGA